MCAGYSQTTSCVVSSTICHLANRAGGQLPSASNKLLSLLFIHALLVICSFAAAASIRSNKSCGIRNVMFVGCSTGLGVLLMKFSANFSTLAGVVGAFGFCGIFATFSFPSYEKLFCIMQLAHLLLCCCAVCIRELPTPVPRRLTKPCAELWACPDKLALVQTHVAVWQLRRYRFHLDRLNLEHCTLANLG